MYTPSPTRQYGPFGSGVWGWATFRTSVTLVSNQKRAGNAIALTRIDATPKVQSSITVGFCISAPLPPVGPRKWSRHGSPVPSVWVRWGGGGGEAGGHQKKNSWYHRGIFLGGYPQRGRGVRKTNFCEFFFQWPPGARGGWGSKTGCGVLGAVCNEHTSTGQSPDLLTRPPTICGPSCHLVGLLTRRPSSQVRAREITATVPGCTSHLCEMRTSHLCEMPQLSYECVDWGGCSHVGLAQPVKNNLLPPTRPTLKDSSVQLDEVGRGPSLCPLSTTPLECWGGLERGKRRNEERESEGRMSVVPLIPCKSSLPSRTGVRSSHLMPDQEGESVFGGRGGSWSFRGMAPLAAQWPRGVKPT